MAEELKSSKFTTDLFISNVIDNKFDLWTTAVCYISLVLWISIIIKVRHALQNLVSAQVFSWVKTDSLVKQLNSGIHIFYIV